MAKTEVQAATGQRMQAAAVQARLSAYELAKRLGVRHVTVYRWWWGQRVPSPARVQAYAAAVGKPVAFFYGAEGEAPEQRGNWWTSSSVGRIGSWPARRPGWRSSGSSECGRG